MKQETHLEKWGQHLNICRPDGAEWMLVSVPQTWIELRHVDSNGHGYDKAYLRDPISEYTEPLITTVKEWRGLNPFYQYDWAWVRTTHAGMNLIIEKLGYPIRKHNPMGMMSMEKTDALAHDLGIDVRLTASHMYFRTEDDAALFRLAI